MRTTTFIGTGDNFKTFTVKITCKCLDVPCVHFHTKRNNMKHYLTDILKATLHVVIWMKRWTLSWILFKSSTRSILLCLWNPWIVRLLKRVCTSLFNPHHFLFINKMKQDLIYVQPSSCYIVLLFLNTWYPILIVIPWWLVWI